MEGRAIQTEALLLRLDVARQRMGANAIIATDGDGTLWVGDIGEALFETLLAERGVRQQAAGMLRDEAQRFGLEVSDQATPTEVAATLLESYRTGGYAEERAFAMMAWAFAGWPEEELAVFSRRVLHDFGFENALREELKVVLQWAAEKAVPVWLVSASPQCGVLAAAEVLNIPSERTLSMEPNRSGGVLEAGLAKPATYGRGKMTRLSAATNDQPLLAAFGDSGYDGAMLRAAEVPVAVYPAPSLKEMLPSLDGVWVLGGDNESLTD